MRGARARRGARVSGRMRAWLAIYGATLCPQGQCSRDMHAAKRLCRTVGPSVALERASVAFAVSGSTIFFAFGSVLRRSLAFAMAAAAPIASVAFTVDTASPESPVKILANHPLVTATTCLGWDPSPPAPGGAAQVHLPTWAMAKVFGDRMSLSQAPADLAASQMVYPMNLRLNGAGWSKPVDEYIACGLLSGRPFRDWTGCSRLPPAAVG
jgi:hypothetical protein